MRVLWSEKTLTRTDGQAREGQDSLGALTGGPWSRHAHRDRMETLSTGTGAGVGATSMSKGTELQFGKMEKSWWWMVGVISQQCECT